MGNSTTTSFNVEDVDTARLVIMSLCETIGIRLRNSENQCSLVSIYIRYSDFRGISKQTKIDAPTNITSKISEVACKLFKQVWDGMPVRHIGVSVSQLISKNSKKLCSIL